MTEERNLGKKDEEASAVQIFLLLWIASSAVHLSEPVTRCPLPWLALVSSRIVNKIICHTLRSDLPPAPWLAFTSRPLSKEIKTLFSLSTLVLD